MINTTMMNIMQLNNKNKLNNTMMTILKNIMEIKIYIIKKRMNNVMKNSKYNNE